MLLPLLLRGRWLAMDCVGAAIWAAGLMAALAAVGDLTAGTAALDQARGAVAGALVGAVVAVAISQIGAPYGGLAGTARDHRLGLPSGPDMSVLRNLEAKLGGLVEGAFGRAFKANVQPVELAHKLAKEMEENQMVSVSRVYVPNHYRVFLSPADREQFASYEPALRKELSDYLLEHARQERLALTSRPQVEFHTDERLELGEFGIQAQLLSPPEEEAPTAPAAPVGGRLRAHDGLLAGRRVAAARAEGRPPARRCWWARAGAAC